MDAITHNSPAIAAQKIPAFAFLYTKYTSMAELVNALAWNWEAGKRRIFMSKTEPFFQQLGDKYAAYYNNLSLLTREQPESKDICYFNLLYTLNPSLSSFHWRSSHYANMNELGHSILDALHDDGAAEIEKFSEMFQAHLFSTRQEIIAPGSQSAQSLKTIEEKFNETHGKNAQYNQLYILAYIGYYYAEEKKLLAQNCSFSSVSELVDRAKQLYINRNDEFGALAGELVIGSKLKKGIGNFLPSPQFAAWLLASGFELSVHKILGIPRLE